MAPTTRDIGRPSLVLLAQTLSLTGLLCASLALVSVPTTRAAGEVTGSDSPGPSPAVSVIPDPSSVLEPSPSPDPTTAPTPDPTVSPEPAPLPAPTIDPSFDPTPTSEPTAAPSSIPDAFTGLHVDHVWVDVIDVRTGEAYAGPIDTSRTGVTRGTLYVVRFQVVNDSDAPVDIQPAIDFAPATAPNAWTMVPAVDPVDGVPLYSSADVRRGQDPAADPIVTNALRLSTSSDPAGVPQSGIDHAGVNPGRALTLGAHAFTELAFTIRATADAQWLATYLVRLSSNHAAVVGSAIATLTLRDSPPVVLSPNQRAGVVVPGPFPRWPLVSSVASSNLVGGGASGPSGLTAPAGPGYVSPHGPYSLEADECAACHSAHTATSRLLLVRPAPQSTMCFACHDGSAALSNVAAQYANPSVPPNNPSTGSYYSHPATAIDNHTSAGDPSEFAGILNRHSACADCHNPHRADGTAAVETTSGWTASGALVGTSGVGVVNGPAAAAPTSYAWLPSVRYEYQLCFKCHSGYTQLIPNTGPPSTWALDKAVELNPANLSYHPVEAPGKNTTAQMGRSLSGTSPYKLWTFTTGSTIRCVSCHGDPSKANPASPPAAGTQLAPHAVPNEGLLVEPYRDRALKGSSESYDAADFALCYVCHAEAPFVDTSQNSRLDSRFPYHGYHTAAILSFTGPAGTIDTAGAGHGDALCAECHFRIHGTTFAVSSQPPTSRLVNFAPDVLPYQGPNPLYAGKLVWTGSSCTLTCHGVDHAGWSY